MNVYELNLDGLVGPTHHYAGLSAGNVASTSNAHQPANPRAAALQGLEKMRFLFRLGLKQGLLPPQQRPNLKLLFDLGFRGTPAEQISKAYQSAPELLSVCYSASSMWTANAATIAPSTDTLDQKMHFTAANLVSNLHRHQEADFSASLLARIFDNEQFFTHHNPLPRSTVTGDEGAANHNRLSSQHASSGVHLFVYGKQALGAGSDAPSPKRYPARQTKEASAAIARSHLLNPDKVILACQNPQAIDLGVFHNDVISVANESVYLVHQEAFYNQQQVLDEIKKKADFEPVIIEISNHDLSVEEAVQSYLFNSQLITLPNGHDMILIAPKECEEMPRIKACIDMVLEDGSNPINQVHYFDLKQSMRNGGGPACLRLRVPVNGQEYQAMHQGILVTEALLDRLEHWVRKHYRTELIAEDLADPQLIHEVLQALDELSDILSLGSIYPFQKI